MKNGNVAKLVRKLKVQDMRRALGNGHRFDAKATCETAECPSYDSKFHVEPVKDRIKYLNARLAKLEAHPAPCAVGRAQVPDYGNHAVQHIAPRAKREPRETAPVTPRAVGLAATDECSDWSTGYQLIRQTSRRRRG